MKNYKKTKLACYLGFITQAIAANFAPLLYLKFHAEYNITLGNIALISTCFFFTQLIVDLFCAKFVDKIGYRICSLLSHRSCRTGFSSRNSPESFCGNYNKCNYICNRQRAY